MVNKTIANEAINKYFSSNSTRWQLANRVLYDLCAEKPLHSNADEIVAKLWIIGRTYAAAIERRKNAANFSGDFYYDAVAPYIIAHSSEIDGALSQLREFNECTNDNLDVILSLHWYLTKLFKDLTELDKRSLVSKYLHFHCPQLFFIYDSRASIALSKMVRKGKSNLHRHISTDHDMVYTDFCVRMLELHSYIKAQFGRDLTPRELDDLLLYY